MSAPYLPPYWPVQEAVYDALLADAAVTALVGTRVFNGIAKQGTTLPYVAIPAASGGAANVINRPGTAMLVTIQVWADGPGDKRAQAVVSAIVGALHLKRLPLDGHAMVRGTVRLVDSRPAEDGVRRRAVLQYDALTREAA